MIFIEEIMVGATGCIIAGVILVVIAAYIYIANLKKEKLRKINERKSTLAKSLASDNFDMKEIYNRYDFLKNNFGLKIIGKRLVAYGNIEDKLVLLKVKEGVLLIGVPTTSVTKEMYFDLRVDYSVFDTDLHESRFFGAENNFLYVGINKHSLVSIEDHIDELVEIIEEKKLRSENRSARIITDIGIYEAIISNSKELYI